jgi:hypothetical protein
VTYVRLANGRRIESCACGGTLVADDGPREIQAAVMRHRRSHRHRRWGNFEEPSFWVYVDPRVA